MATIEDLHPDLLTRALRHLDGPSLAAVSCATTHLCSLSTDPNLWRDLCLSTWPSLHLLPSLTVPDRSFFSDAHPFPSSSSSSTADLTTVDLPTSLISAIDIYHRGVPILSRIVDTDASTPWFQSSPFRIEALNKDSQAAAADISPEELTLSWIIIDPSRQRAVNVSSRMGLALDRHWYTGDTLVRFATVVGGGTDGECAVGMVVACGEEGHVREVSLTVEDMDGTCLSGRESLIVLKGLMDRRRTVREGAVEAGRRYAEHLGRRRRWKERKLRREGLLDLFCSAIGVTLFLAYACWWFSGH